MKTKPGSRLRSQVDATEIIIVRAPAAEVELQCGGHPMIDAAQQPEPGLAPGSPADADIKLGKRYIVEGRTDLEFLVTKAGEYGIAVDGAAVVAKAAKPLPASD
ncbi:hypothetical protein ACFYU5_25920 [Nocardia aobensis]|uniref:10 kDa chaperonin n=1 Tax=Nocardia aobensis TaxID=257277 RepID=A0ABW6P9N1_9NOCA